jgi:transcriptional regulator with XRE-family HTH domain
MRERQQTIFRDNLIHLRQTLGLSQEEAARKIGIKRSRLASYEEGRATPGPDILVKICDGLSITDLYAFLTDPSYSLRPYMPTLEQRYRALPEKERKLIDLLLGDIP